jgi:hypothetical protein
LPPLPPPPPPADRPAVSALSGLHGALARRRTYPARLGQRDARPTGLIRADVYRARPHRVSIKVFDKARNGNPCVDGDGSGEKMQIAVKLGRGHDGVLVRSCLGLPLRQRDFPHFQNQTAFHRDCRGR